jgi:fucose permease
MFFRRRSMPPAAGVLGAGIYFLVGWCGLLVPSLIRSVEATYAQSDAGIGIYYLVAALAYAAGSFAGALATERIGRRPVLGFASVLLSAGLATLGGAPSVEVFVLAAVPMGLGVGALDGGANGLYLDVFRFNRGRALNLLHLCFSLGALSAPLAAGPVIEAGLPWQVPVFATAVVAFLVAAPLLTVPMPAGRRSAGGTASAAEVAERGSVGQRIPMPLLVLCLAIGFYIASEVGVTDWMVRFLEPAPVSLATSALALFWALNAIGRLASARIADYVDHIGYAAVAAVTMSLAIAGAILVPSVWASAGLFALAGLAAGPVAPMIVAAGGDRYPDRSAAVGGYMTTAAVAGSIGLPTLMGFMSVTVGLQIAMMTTVGFGLACATALWLAGRNRRSQARSPRSEERDPEGRRSVPGPSSIL